jgi:hypothetical protein
MVAPVPFLASAGRKALPPQLDGLRELLDGLIDLPLAKRDEAQVVVTLGVSIEAVDEEPEHGRGLLVLTALIQAGRVLLGIGRHVATLQGKLPVEGVIRIPFAWGVVPELEPPCDQLRQILELVMVLLDHCGIPYHEAGVLCTWSCKHTTSAAGSDCKRDATRASPVGDGGLPRVLEVIAGISNLRH